MFSIYEILPEILELWGDNLITQVDVKKQAKSSREMTTALFLLRCVEVGISIRDLDLLTIGMVLDIFVEKWNDNIEENRNTGFVRMAQQADFDIF